MVVPDYDGGSLVNLIAELEVRLTGSSPSPPLHAETAGAVPEAATYVLVLFDGLGADQMSRPEAGSLGGSHAATIQAPFPTTTTVSIASIGTGLPPARHGLLGYELWLPDQGVVANTIHWTELGGGLIEMDHEHFLPRPNLWERLAASDKEAITVQPGHFVGSPMSVVQYRGARYEPAYTFDEMIDITVDVAARPGRLVFTYFPNVDVSAHRQGMASEEYSEALAAADRLWERLMARMPNGVVLLGTSDHGQTDDPDKVAVPDELEAEHRVYGDGRVMFVHGDGSAFAADLPARWVGLDDMLPLFGPGPPHPEFQRRAPAGALFADDGYRLLHRHSDPRLISAHGGLTKAEREIPLLVKP